MKYLLLLSLIFLIPAQVRAMEDSQEQNAQELTKQTNNPFNLLPNEILEHVLEFAVRGELSSLLDQIKRHEKYLVPKFALTNKRFLGFVKKTVTRIAKEPTVTVVDDVPYIDGALLIWQKENLPLGLLFALHKKKEYPGASYYELWRLERTFVGKQIMGFKLSSGVIPNPFFQNLTIRHKQTIDDYLNEIGTKESREAKALIEGIKNFKPENEFKLSL